MACRNADRAALAGSGASRARCLVSSVGGSSGIGYLVGDTVVIRSESLIFGGVAGGTGSAFGGIRMGGKSVGLVVAESDDDPLGG